jgi:hypothetical protein
LLTEIGMDSLGRADYFIIGGLLVAVLFGLSILVFIVVFVRREQQANLRCPHCAETIKAGATVCRFCNRPV